MIRSNKRSEIIFENRQIFFFASASAGIDYHQYEGRYNNLIRLNTTASKIPVHNVNAAGRTDLVGRTGRLRPKCGTVARSAYRTTSMEDDPLPTGAFDQLLDNLANVIVVTRKQGTAANNVLSQQERQELLQTERSSNLVFNRNLMM